MPEQQRFSATFDEAWQRFLGGEPLVAIDAQREGFVRGRAQFITLQVPIGEMPVTTEIAAVQEQLADIEGLSLIPEELLHISVRGVGWQVIAKTREDDVMRQEVGAIGERAAKALSGAKPLEVTIGPVNVFPDALVLEVNPVEPMRELLARLAEISPRDAFPYPAGTYLPHVTIATFLDAGVAADLRKCLPAMRELAPLAATITRIDYARWWFTGHDLTEWPELDTIRTFGLR
jgi:2'-5' RNA ligase